MRNSLFFSVLMAGFLGLFGFSVIGFATPAEAACRHGNGIGVSRTVFLNTNGGARFGSSHGGHRNFLRKKEVVLTFDDGPVPGKTAKVLAALERHCTKATFFMVGRMAANNPRLVKQVLARGHTVGVHSYSHRNLGQTNAKAAIQDVHRAIKAIHRAAGRTTTAFFRFPYLSENRSVNSMLKQRNYGVFAVDVDSKDYKISNPSTLVNRVMSELNRKGKGIILMHDIQNVTANGLDQLLTRLDKAGYRIVHIRGSGGRTIEEPILLASNENDFDDKIKNAPIVASLKKKKSNGPRSAALKRPAKKLAKKVEKKTSRPKAKKIVQTKKPKPVRVSSLSKRQRAIIKKRQRAFKERLASKRKAFRSILKKRLITQ